MFKMLTQAPIKLIDQKPHLTDGRLIDRQTDKCRSLSVKGVDLITSTLFTLQTN